MFCPHCSNKIPDGSNICPICYANLAGMKPQSAKSADAQEDRAAQPRPRSSGKKTAYAKGSRGTKKSADRTPMIIAIGLILILAIIIAMIVRSMFMAGDSQNTQNVQSGAQAAASAAPQFSPGTNFVVFGATNTPAPRVTTPVPQLEVTPEPATPAPVSYNTLKKGDIGTEVVTLQQALAELGYLSGAADGNFGTGTQNAVKKFQEDNGLDADGIAGKMTLEALFAKSSVTPIPETTVGPDDIMNLPG